MNNKLKLGIIGTGRIANRFVKEASVVSGVIVHSVMSRNIKMFNSLLKSMVFGIGFWLI